MDFLNYIGPGLAIGLAGIGVAIGQGILAKKAMEVMGKTPKMMTFFLTVTILGIALLESAVIYGLVIAFKIFSVADLSLLSSIGAGLAIGLAGLGVGVGEGQLIAGALGAMNKNPELKGKIMTFMVLFVALVEVTAIYGLIVAFKIIETPGAGLTAIGAGLAIGLAGLGVAIGRGIMGEKSLEVMGKNPKMISFFLTVSILGVALIESAAIYGLVISFQILGADNIGLYSAIGAGLAIGLTGLGAGWGEGQLISGALTAINRNPQIKGKIMTFMVLFVALVEVTAIYGLIIAVTIMNNGMESFTAIGAGLAIGLAGLGVAIGRGIMAEESLEVMGKNPKMISFFLTVSILGVALIESAAIYALVISFQILGIESITLAISLSAGLAIGLTGLGVGLGEGLLIKGGINGMNKSPESKGRVMAFMVLFVALIEVIAIYGLIVSVKVLNDYKSSPTEIVSEVAEIE